MEISNWYLILNKKRKRWREKIQQAFLLKYCYYRIVIDENYKVFEAKSRTDKT